jgi:hypothetical protein
MNALIRMIVVAFVVAYIPHIYFAIVQAFPDIGSPTTKQPTGQSLGYPQPAGRHFKCPWRLSAS